MIDGERNALARTLALLDRSVEEQLVPCAAAEVGTSGGQVTSVHAGWAQLTPRRRRLHAGMCFDLASLTKVIATTTLTLQAVEQGRVYLGQRVASILPEFAALGKQDVTVRHLLSHTSGLPAWRDLSDCGNPTDALARVWRTPLERPPGSAVVYSDLGFITLGEALVRIHDMPLDQLARRDVFEPLGMNETSYRPAKGPTKDRSRCVPTEALESRGGLIAGEVHDDNAHALGGVAGHAGLFASLEDVGRFCRMWLRSGLSDSGRRILSPAAVAAATRDQTGGADPQNRRGLGWVLQPNSFWPAADLVSPVAFSHTGFTGTSIVIDPAFDRYAVLLTNRVHPTRGEGSADRIRLLRARFHNAAWSDLR